LPLHLTEHAPVERPTTLPQEALVRHFEREGVLEGVLELREKTGLVEELRGL